MYMSIQRKSEPESRIYVTCEDKTRLERRVERIRVGFLSHIDILVMSLNCRHSPFVPLGSGLPDQFIVLI